MPPARIEPLAGPYEPAVAEAFLRIMPPGMEPLKLFRTQARNTRVFLRMLAGNLLDKGTITLRERELIILRTCARCDSEYEWGVHVALFAEKAALSKAAISATLKDSVHVDGLTASERALFEAIDSLHEHSAIPDPLWEKLASHYRTDQIMEILALCGFYHTISFITNATQVELEAFAPRFESYATR